MKKRYLGAAALFAVSLLFGCSNDSSPKNAVTDFSATAVVVYGEEKTQYNLSSNLSEIIMTAESGNMKGLEYRCGDGNIQASFGDVTVSREEELLKSSAPYMLYSAITSLRNPEELEPKSGETTSTYSGKNEAGKFCAEVENDSGYITKIEYKDSEFSAELSNVREYK